MNKKLLVWLILYFILIGLTLNNPTPYKGDESFYLISGINMVKNHNYIIPYYYNKIRLQKPILAYWVVIAGYKIFGIHLWSGRIFFLLFSIFLLFIIYKFSLLLNKNNNQSALLNVLLLSSSTIYILFSRAAMTDLLLTFFMTLSLYYFYKSIVYPEKLKKFYSIAYLSMGFAFLSKGLIGVFPVLIMFVYLICFKPKDYMKYILNLFNPLNIFVFVIVAFSWYIYIFIFYKKDLLMHLKKESSGKLKFNIYIFVKRLFYYIGVLIRYYFPFFLIAFYLFIKKRIKFSNQFKFLLLYICSIIIFFTFFIGMYRSRYLLPVFPVITILIGFIINKNNLSIVMQKTAVIFFLLQAILLISLPIIRGNPMKELALYCKEKDIKKVYVYNIGLRSRGWLEIFTQGKTTYKQHEPYKQNDYIIINAKDHVKFKNHKIIIKAKSLKKIRFVNGEIVKKFQYYFLMR